MRKDLFCRQFREEGVFNPASAEHSGSSNFFLSSPEKANIQLFVMLIFRQITINVPEVPRLEKG